jgi:hopanoid biosynthesis associated protein HpnK
VTTSVIINADDFGLSPGVNRGIVSAFREGVLTSTTMLVNLEAFEDAVRLARENPELPVGVHLSLLWGRPVSRPDEVPTLIRRDGEFPRSLAPLASRYFLRGLSLDQVRREFRNQIRAFIGAGLVPTHVDTHKHVHCLPGILDALTAAATECDVSRVRLPSEERLPAPLRSWKVAGKRRLIRFLCRRARSRLQQAGMRTTDHFVGIGHTGSLNSDVLNLILSNLRSGVTEIMCHPGYVDEQARKYSSTPLHREVELASLNDPRVKDRIAAGAIRLMHYGDL